MSSIIEATAQAFCPRESSGIAMADCRAEVDQEIEGGHYDDTAEERMQGQAQWLVLTETVQKLDETLEVIDCDLKGQYSVAQGKLVELKAKAKRNLEKNLESFRGQWTSRVKEIVSMRQAAKKFKDEKARLRSENQYLEKMVARLQEQFAETVDSSLAEIQELTILNSELTRKIHHLESKLEIGEKKLTRIVQDSMDGMQRVVELSSVENVTPEKIYVACKEEVRKLERSTTLENMFQVDTDDYQDLNVKTERERTFNLAENRLKDTMTELQESQNQISHLKHHICHLEADREEQEKKYFSYEDSEEDRSLVDQLMKSIIIAVETADPSDVIDLANSRKQISGLKKISQRLRGGLADVYKSIMSKEDELSDLRDNIDEIKLKWKNSSTKMEGVEEENDYLRRKLEQEENRSKITGDEIISLQNRIQLIENEKKSYRDQIHDLRESKEDLKVYCNNLSRENEKCLQEISRLQSERDLLMGQLQDTTKRASESAQESLNIEERHDNLEKSFNKLKRDFQEQNREFLAVTRENEELKTILQEQQGERDKFKNEFRNIDIVNKDLEDQIFQLSNENERLLSEQEKLKRGKQTIEVNLRDLKHELDKKESNELHSEQKIKELNRSVRELSQKNDAVHSAVKEKTAKISNLSDKISIIDTFLRQFFRQRKELLSIVNSDSEDMTIQRLTTLAGTNFELDHGENEEHIINSISPVLEKSFEKLLKSLRYLNSYHEDCEAYKQKLALTLRRFLRTSEAEDAYKSEEDEMVYVEKTEKDSMENVIGHVKKLVLYCEKMENEVDLLKRSSLNKQTEHSGEISQLEEITSKTIKKLSLQEQKERTLVLKLKNKKNVETALRGKISRLRKEVKEIKSKTTALQCRPKESREQMTEAEETSQSIEEMALWREFMKNIVEEFNVIKEKTEKCMEEDIAYQSVNHDVDHDSDLQKRSSEIALQIQVLLRNTKESLLQKELEIEEQLAGRRLLEDKLSKVEGECEALSKDKQACSFENMQLKQFRDMIVRYTVAATRQLDIVLDSLSGKECVVMFRRTEEKPFQGGEVHSSAELMSFVRETLKANEQTLQASIASLEMVKAKGVCDFVLDENLFSVGSEQRELLKIMRRMNQSVDSVTKRLRTLMIGAEFVRAGSLQVLNDCGSSHQEDSLINSPKIDELEESLAQKEELLKVLDLELEQLRGEKDKLMYDIRSKDTDLKILRSDVQRLTTSSEGLESELMKIRKKYEMTSSLLQDKETEVARLNDILKQHDDGSLNSDFDRDEAMSTLERKRGEIKLLRRNLDDIYSVHNVNERRIRTLQSRIEGVSKYICDRETESDSGLTSLSRDSNTQEQVFIVKELEVKAERAQLYNLNDNSMPPPCNVKATTELEETKLKTQLQHKEQENTYLQSVVRELKVELQKVQTSLKSVNDPRSSHIQTSERSIAGTRPKSSDQGPPRGNSLSTSVAAIVKDADDSSDTITVRSNDSSTLFSYKQPVRWRPCSDFNTPHKPYDPHDCEMCSQGSDIPAFTCSDDECDCVCSECDCSDASVQSDGDLGKVPPTRGYQHNINSSKEARKVSLREATQAIRAKNRKIAPERVRVSQRRSLSPTIASSFCRSYYDSESASSSDYPSSNFRHPRKVSGPGQIRQKSRMVPPQMSYRSSSPDPSISQNSVKTLSARSQFSSDESQGECKHSSSSGGRSCTSPLDCKGHDCKKRRKHTFSLQVASATREKGGKLM